MHLAHADGDGDLGLGEPVDEAHAEDGLPAGSVAGQPRRERARSSTESKLLSCLPSLAEEWVVLVLRGVKRPVR